MKVITMILMMLAGVTAVFADNGFLYGKVVTADKKEFTGYIRWGTEETYWVDEFNAVKTDNSFYNLLSKKDRRLLSESHGDRGDFRIFDIRIGKLNKSNFIHQFVCRFGDIKKISLEDDVVVLTMKNGESFEVGDNSNDIGAKITIQDASFGKIVLRWNRIESIEFLSPSKTREDERPLYGTVQSKYGSYTGFIQWDAEERLASDELDGDTDDGRVSLLMGSIRSMEKKRKGVIVKTNDKQELYLTGTNDVDGRNRGIVVTDVTGMIVEIPWEAFQKVEFSDKAPKLPKYNDFQVSKRLKGTVKTYSGEKYDGILVYDLDEAWDYEQLEGKDRNDFEYRLLFRDISSIEVNDDATIVVLKNEKKLELVSGQDVGERHQGILVLKDAKDKKPVYIPWDDCATLTF